MDFQVAPVLPVDQHDTHHAGSLFYLPGWIWGQVEGDRVAKVVGEKGLRPLGDLMTQPEEELKRQACKVAKRLSELQGSHRPWAIRLVATELLALCNLVAQFFFIDHFVG